LVPDPIASVTPAASATSEAFITINTVPATGYPDDWTSRAGRLRVELTLGGPTVIDLDDVETVPTSAGDHVLTFWLNQCESPLGCWTGTPNNGVHVICTYPITLDSGDSLLVRVNLNRKRCVQAVLPRPARPVNPASITGQLLLGNRSCPYLIDRWGRFWDLRLPEGWSVAVPHQVINSSTGQPLAGYRDWIRARGSRDGAHSTGCAMHEQDNLGAGYRVTAITVVRAAR
jgi:hypothetical protein